MLRRTPRSYTSKPLEERFHANYVVDAATGCWLWRGARAGGYGRLRSGATGTPSLGAHRVSYELHKGPIPDGLLVCHSCDNPPCVNPDHLFLGTIGDNNRDRSAKGRGVRGDRWYEVNRGRWGVRYNGEPPTVANGRPRRTKPDPVTGAVRWAVMRRDRGCVLSKRDPMHLCRDRWGNWHAANDVLRLTVEHVKDAPRMGVRAPSDLSHLVALCYAANVGVPSKDERAWIREYLRGVA